MPAAQPIRVYYLASGRIGIPVLDALCQDPRLTLVGIGSQPDKPGGRKNRPVATPVATHAQSLNLALDKPERVNTPDFLAHLREMQIELLVVASFGQILKPELLDLPQYGCLNVHASLLPRHRGASPINAAILSGDAETGISFMKMDPGLDTGPVYRMVAKPIGPDENALELEDNLGVLAARHIGDVICGLADGSLVPQPQPAEGSTYAKKIKKTDGAADWSQGADVIERQVRAYTPWPSLFAILPTDDRGTKRIRITKAVVRKDMPASAPGTVISQDGKSLVIACGSLALEILKLVPEGRNEMNTAEFLRGTHVMYGTQLPVHTSEQI